MPSAFTLALIRLSVASQPRTQGLGPALAATSVARRAVHSIIADQHMKCLRLRICQARGTGGDSVHLRREWEHNSPDMHVHLPSTRGGGRHTAGFLEGTMTRSCLNGSRR